MSISRLVPPLEYMRAASRASLQSFELARLNHAANLRREISALIDQWIQETSQATLARWMLDHHESLHDQPRVAPDNLSTFPEPPADPLPDSPPLPADIVCAPPRFSAAHDRVGATLGRKPQKQKSTATG